MSDNKENTDNIRDGEINQMCYERSEDISSINALVGRVWSIF